MATHFTHQPGYAHYKSATFAREWYISSSLFTKMMFGKWHYPPRPWDAPVTPNDDLSDSESCWSSDDGYENQPWGPDEDYYISMAEDSWQVFYKPPRVDPLSRRLRAIMDAF